MTDQTLAATPATPTRPARTASAVGWTVWFPALFFLGFLFFYLLPFLNPTPHNVQVAVSAPAAAPVQAALGHASPGAFAIQPVAGPAQARQEVLDRQVTAAYVIGPHEAVLYVAQADDPTLESVVTSAFADVAGHSDQPMTITDLLPQGSGDPTGHGLFYLSLAWNIPSYVVVMMFTRSSFRRRAQLLVALGWGAVISLTGFGVAVGLGAIPANPLIALTGFLLAEAVTLTCVGLVPYTKRFFPGAAVMLFVMLSIPSSGGAVPVPLVPGFFRALHPVMPLGNALDALRDFAHFGGADATRPLLVLSAWIVAGLALTGASALAGRRRVVQPQPAPRPESRPEPQLAGQAAA